jgi:hypothetical protein
VNGKNNGMPAALPVVRSKKRCKVVWVKNNNTMPSFNTPIVPFNTKPIRDRITQNIGV